MSIAILVALLLLLILVRVPVGIALLVPSLLYLALDPNAELSIAVQQLTGGANSFALLAIPMFILLGNLATAAGITNRIFDFASSSLRKVRGSLGYVNVATSVGFSLVSGAAISDAAAMAKIQVPEMVKRGYDPRFTLGLTASSSLIAPMVPPSIPAVIYAITAGVSISALFIAGIIPAIILTVLLVVYVAWATRKMKSGEDFDATDFREPVWKLFLKVIPTFGAPVLILGGILLGWFTPTEASAAGVFYMLLLGIMYRSMTLGNLISALRSATSTTASIMFIVVGAALFGWILARERVPQELGDTVLSITENPLVFLLLLNLVLLVVGAILEPTAAILIMVPVLSPMALEFGIDPVHMGVVVIFNLMIGLLTPPVGLVLFVINGVTGYSVTEVIKGTMPFYGLLLISLAAITFGPFVIGSY
ncbi:TRAP transporter large permease [Nesterenkonia jeotgali]|uniref:C4-dicarboxylate ABC transporter permease n=1 Tax=Nesterenkonia jeotgali TaxID=317018 RepID=A0A0W8IFZ9_9MICC|nr:TRAP transporter large permease [Nesterenkonia jeotgali]KUG58884.1 C4-dicarboxylate ABC transporter permease [Nesterenkonia jeotgali]